MASPQALWPGGRLGPYEIVARLGAGAMGEVWRARDPQLEREVALKVLPPELASDPERLARFEREAKALAALSHPNIIAIHTVESAGGVRFLTTELVEGRTLDRLIPSTGMELDQFLSLAAPLADALAAAHARGVLHRDLKPTNVMVTAEGRVKVLDFGLAKFAEGPAENPEDLAEAKTKSFEAMTGEGRILGTVPYLSPEQVQGKRADARSDLFSLGSMFYEMVTGRRPFQGASSADVLSSILRDEPRPLAELRPEFPQQLGRLLRRCLTKDPERRVQSAKDLRNEIEDLQVEVAETRRTASTSVPTISASARRKRPLWFGVGAVAVLSLGVLLAPGLGGRVLDLLGRNRQVSSGPAGQPDDRRVSRFEVLLPDDGVMYHGFNPDLALSPDGSTLAFASFGGVYLRRLGQLETGRLESAADYSSAPLFSPDGKNLAFIGGNAIMSANRPFLVAALSGGAAVKLAEYDMFHRGDWGEDGSLYWTSTYPGGIVRTPASGGPTEAVTTLDLERGERSHRFANLLPGGQALLYTVGFDGIQTYDDARIDVWDLRTQQHKTLIVGGTSPIYSPSGHIVYARGGRLLAVPFDTTTLEVSGAPVEVMGGVMTSANTGIAQFTLSKRGDLAYVPGSPDGATRKLVWVDRSGKAEPLPLPPGSYLSPRVSPDGKQLAVELEGPNHDLMLYDFARGVLSKVTTDGLSHNPVWAPDGARFAFRSWQAGGMTMWSMPADRSAPASRLDPQGTRQSPVSYSPDGKFLAFDQKDPQTSDDAWVLPLDGVPIAVARSRFREGSAKFSPDGRWVAYASDESGKSEVYVQAFPGPGAKQQVSRDGGIDPVWRRSGGELYYRNGGGMMLVSINTARSLSVSAPTQLWKGEYSSGSGSSCGMPGPASSNYDVTPDGQRFLMVQDDLSWAPANRIVVVLNWTEELRKLMSPR